MAIEKLTSEQERALLQWRDEWIALGTSNEPADRKRTEAAISSMYEVLERPAPRFEWVATPLELLHRSVKHSAEILPPKIRMLVSSDPFGDSVDALRDSLGGILAQRLLVKLKEDMGKVLRATLADELGEYVHSALRDPVHARIFSELREELYERLSSLRVRIVAGVASESGISEAYLPILERRLGMLLACSGTVTMTLPEPAGPLHLFWAFTGQQEVYWVGFYAFCQAVLGARYDPETSRRLALWVEACHSGWWAPYDGYCICADRCARPTMMNAELPDAPATFWGRVSSSLARSFGEFVRGVGDGAR
jgi:hypothetical protein